MPTSNCTSHSSYSQSQRGRYSLVHCTDIKMQAQLLSLKVVIWDLSNCVQRTKGAQFDSRSQSFITQGTTQKRRSRLTLGGSDKSTCQKHLQYFQKSSGRCKQLQQVCAHGFGHSSANQINSNYEFYTEPLWRCSYSFWLVDPSPFSMENRFGSLRPSRYFCLPVAVSHAT